MKIPGRIVLSVVIASVLMFGGVAWSASMRGHGPWGGPSAYSSPEMLSSLGITDEQKVQLKALAERYKASAGPLRSQFASERRDMRKLVHAKPPNDDAIRELSTRMAGTGAELAIQRAHFFSELRGAFTPDQIRKVEVASSKETSSKSDLRTDMALGQIARSIARQ